MNSLMPWGKPLRGYFEAACHKGGGGGDGDSERRHQESLAQQRQMEDRARQEREAQAEEERQRAERVRLEEEARQARIRQGISDVNNIFDSNFNDQFYTGVRQGYMDYNNPLMQHDYSEAKKNLAFALSRAGASDSSISAQRQAELERQFGLAQNQSLMKAQDYEKGSRDAVESARSQAINQAQATADPTVATTLATNSLPALLQSPQYTPLKADYSSVLANLITSGLESAGNFSASQRKQAALDQIDSIIASNTGRTSGYSVG